MEPQVDIWNILHDGEITVVGREGADLIVFVSIPYLRARFSPLGDSFSLRLKNLRLFSLIDRNGVVKSTDPVSLNQGGQEILSTESVELPVTVTTTMADMVLDYERVDVTLDTGQPVSYGELLAAATQYWEEFRSGKWAEDNPKQQR